MYFSRCLIKAVGILTLIFSGIIHSQELHVSDFANLPGIKQMRLSPDGKSVVYMMRNDDKNLQGTVVVVYDIKTGMMSPIISAPDGKFSINWISWANDRKVFVSASFPDFRYSIPTVERRLLIVDIETKKRRNVISKGTRKKFGRLPQFQDRIIDKMPLDPNHFLLQVDGDVSNQPTVYKVWLNKNKMNAINRRAINVKSWMTDSQSNVRIGTYFKGTKYKILHSFAGDQDWRPLWEFEAFADDQVWPMGFSKNSNELYVLALHNGKDAIFRVDVTDSNLTKELVYADENYDVSGELFYSASTGEAVGIRVSNDDGYIFWDESYAGLKAGIDKFLPDTKNRFISFSQDERKYILLSQNETNPGTYYLGDRDKKSLIPLAYQYPNLPEKLMSPKVVVSYKARDGLGIEGFLTLPRSHNEGDKHPTIIFPHGGPISNDGKGFDYWTQFFANNGYAVLQMNFRGSSGYGHDFMTAGLKSWGLAMQDDVEDGTRWMIAQGYSDPSNICIVGASYGGYAALMGAVKSSGLYQCAVSFAGVSNISLLVKANRNYTNYEVVKEQIGSNHKELKSRSPQYHADEIDIPVLLIHGTQDRSVRIRQSKRMNKALKKAKKDVEYLVLEDGDHYLSKNEHRVATFEAMDKFLKQHLKTSSKPN